MNPRRIRAKHLRRAAQQTLGLSDSAVSTWHSVLFALNIGIPALVGLALGEVAAGIVGAIAGLLFSLSDKVAPLRERLTWLLRSVVVLLLFGILGSRLGGYTPIFWAIFVVLCFAVACISLADNAGASAFRYGAMAILSTAGSGDATINMALMVLVAAGVSTLTRTIGSRYFPLAVNVAVPFVRRETLGDWAGVRYCLIYTLAVSTGLALGQIEGAIRPIWVATTVLLVMQPEARSSYQRIAQRVIGTLVGVTIATTIVVVFYSLWLLAGIVLVLSFLLPHGTSRHYWLHSAFTACLILVLYDFAGHGHDFDAGLLNARLVDATVGCLLALGGTVIAFPPLRFMTRR